MANEQNLRPAEHKLTVEEAKKGGRNSVKARKEKKLLKQCLQELMQSEVAKDKDGNPITGVEAMATVVFKSALKGDWKAWELARDTAGEKPVEKVITAEIETDVIKEVEKMVKSAK